MKNKSFTLIELLVVIVIIGILAGVIIVSTSSSISKANIAKVKVFENSIQNELGANMVSRWKLDEIVGTTTTPDAWGSNTGTLGDGVTTSTYPALKTEAECVTGKCMYFDGTNDYINCGNGNNLNISNTITIGAWIKPIADNNFRIILQKGLWNQLVVRKESDNNLMFRLYYTDATNSGEFEPFNLTEDFQYITIVWDNSLVSNNLKGYKNGILEKQTTNGVGKTIFSSTGNFIIGTDGGTEVFKGLIDDVRIYNAALSSAQIKQEYVAGLNSLLANGNILKEEYNKRIENIGSNF